MASNKQSPGSPGAGDVRTWSSQIIPKQSVVSGQASVQTAGTPGAATNAYAKAIYDMSTAERKTLGQSLKNMGYKVNTNGVYSRALVDAYTLVVQQAQFDAAQLGQPFSNTFLSNFIVQEIAARGGATGGGPRITEQASVITDSDAKLLINAVIRDQNGRAASAKEIEKYTAILQRKAAKSPTVTKSETVGGKTIIKTQPGFGAQEAQSFLLDKISGTDEAKANKVLGYYETFMNALGGK